MLLFMKNSKLKQVTHLNTNPRSGQYLTHVHSYITWVVAAIDSCFGLVRPHHDVGVQVCHLLLLLFYFFMYLSCPVLYLAMYITYTFYVCVQ